MTSAVALLSFAATLATAAAAEVDGAAENGAGDQNDERPVALLLAPPALALDDALAGGCWARLYKTRDYAGTVLTLTGPLAIPSMGSGVIGGSEIGRTSESVVTGPKAKLTVWAKENYDENRMIFEPGQKVPELRRVKSYFDEINSLKLDCPP